jgi:hypothetical protein
MPVAMPVTPAARTPPSAGPRETSSTPADGHDGATVTRNAHVTATTGDNASKITERGRERRLATADGPWEDDGMSTTRKGHAS